MGGQDFIKGHPDKGSPLDFTHRHPVFDIKLQKVGSEFGQIYEKRQQYIRLYAGKVQVAEPFVPKNIPGLVPKTGPLPQTRKFWKRPTTSFERNGIMNIHTPNFNTRIVIPLFWTFLIYGWWGHATYGMYRSRYEVNDEIPENMYDKLNTRVPPIAKIWLRPG